MSYEYRVGRCKTCKKNVLGDEGHTKLGDTYLEGVVCESCHKLDISKREK